MSTPSCCLRSFAMVGSWGGHKNMGTTTTGVCDESGGSGTSTTGARRRRSLALGQHQNRPPGPHTLSWTVHTAKLLARHTYTHCSTQSRGVTPLNCSSETTSQCQPGRGASTTLACTSTPIPSTSGVSCSKRRVVGAQQ